MSTKLAIYTAMLMKAGLTEDTLWNFAGDGNPQEARIRARLATLFGDLEYAEGAYIRALYSVTSHTAREQEHLMQGHAPNAAWVANAAEQATAAADQLKAAVDQISVFLYILNGHA